MRELSESTKDFLIKTYYEFQKKLYGEKTVSRNLEFEKLVEQKFGKELDKDIDVEVTLGIKTRSGKKTKREARSLGQFVYNNTGVIPEDTTHIVFYGEFVERNDKGEKLRAEKKADRFAFQEQIQVVKNIDNKNLSKKDSIVKKFEKEDLESFSGIINFEKNELVL